MSQAAIYNNTVYLAGRVGDPGHPPTRAAGKSRLATPDYLVEVIVVAAAQ